MTAPGPGQFTDAGNPLLAGGPARLDLGSVQLPGGAVVHMVTVRTSSATVTAVLTAESLRDWAVLLSEFARSAGGSPLAVPTPAETIVLGNGNGRPR